MQVQFSPLVLPDYYHKGILVKEEMSTPELVVCFGDSLTAGFQSPTRENPAGRETPYSRWLQQDLGSVARVVVSGTCGELTGDMVKRFGRDVTGHKPGYVVILGGTNDLGWSISPSEIIRNLENLYDKTREVGGVPVPVTVPSIRVEDAIQSREGMGWLNEHLERRRQLNGFIQEYASAQSLACVDLFTATADANSGQLAARYSNDGLHLTTDGYRLFALLVAQVLNPLLRQKAPS